MTLLAYNLGAIILDWPKAQSDSPWVRPKFIKEATPYDGHTLKLIGSQYRLRV